VALVLDSLRTLVPDGLLALPAGAGLRFFADCLDGVGTPPALVIHVLTCEAGSLADDSVAGIVRQAMHRFPEAHHCIVGLACLGFYAALMHVRQSRPRSAIVQVIDAPLARTQAMLDTLGMGAGADSMVAQESLAFLQLRHAATSRLAPADIVVRDSVVVAKPAGMAGSLAFMARIDAALRAGLPHGGDLVSFEIGSPWSRRLHAWFERDVRPRLPPLRWLASSESDSLHRLSVKPLLEIEHYRAALEQGGALALCTLGAGGRFGLLTLASGAAVMAGDHGWRGVAPWPASQAVQRAPVTLDADLPRIPAESGYLFAAPDYRGIDNLYFYWPVDDPAARNEIVVPAYAPAHAPHTTRRQAA
jgi:hypothetical protein